MNDPSNQIGHTANQIIAFVDESKPDELCRWMYLGVTLLRRKNLDLVVQDLDGFRDKAQYFREIHFHSITTAPKSALASGWLEYARTTSRTRTVVFGIDIDRLNPSNFGSNLKDSVQARFTRSALALGIKRFGGGNATLGDIYLDRGNLESVEGFGSNLISKLKWENGIKVATGSVHFVESNHRESSSDPDLSHLIQATDVSLGAVRQCMECSSQKNYKMDVASSILPEVEIATIGRSVTSASAGYSTNFAIRFFPSPSDGKFYGNRKPAMSLGAPDPLTS